MRSASGVTLEFPSAIGTGVGAGTAFAGAGAALMATVGVWMVGMVVLGIVYMGIGIWMKRSNQN